MAPLDQNDLHGVDKPWITPALSHLDAFLLVASSDPQVSNETMDGS